MLSVLLADQLMSRAVEHLHQLLQNAINRFLATSGFHHCDVMQAHSDWLVVLDLLSPACHNGGMHTVHVEYCAKYHNPELVTTFAT